MMWEWGKKRDLLGPQWFVDTVHKAKSLEMIEWIINELLFQMIDSCSFARFDEEHGRVMISRIFSLGANQTMPPMLRLLCERKMLYLCQNGRGKNCDANTMH